MFTRVCLSFALLTATPVWSQAGMSAGGGTSDQAQMMTPPPVSGGSYSTEMGSETRSNYLRTGLTFNTAYSDNVFPDVGTHPISDISYSIYPTIAIDQTLSRLHWMLTYNPGFTIYQRTSGYDQADQNAVLSFRYRWSPHVTVSLQDSLVKTSSMLDQPDQLSQGAVSGAAQPTPIDVIAPVADMLSNTANVRLTYQFSRNGMIGAGAAFTNLDFLNPAQVPGLADSNSSGESGFYSYRISAKQYTGGVYQYSRILIYPVNAQSEIQTHTFLFFYTVYLKPTFSLSFSGGTQHYDISQPPLPVSGAWSPALTVSSGWQGSHTNFAVSYSRVITGGGGLVGVFQSNSANALARWQTARTWSVGAAASYAINKNVTPSSFLSTEGGHSIVGTVSVQHQLSERFQVEFGYTHLHQSYSDIPVISNAPNTNREFITFSYHFARPLGG